MTPTVAEPAAEPTPHLAGGDGVQAAASTSRLVGGPVVTAVALLAWLAVVVVAARRGVDLREVAKVRSIPLMGIRDPSPTARIPLPVVVGVGLAWGLPPLCARLGWRRLLAVVAIAAIGWGVAVASMRGVDATSGGEPIRLPGNGLVRGVASEHDYASVVPIVEEQGIGPFTETYTDPEVLATYAIHVQGHPVGAPLAFVALDEVGLGTPSRSALVLILVGGTIGPAVLLAAREVAGEAFARAAAPFLVLAPSAIWLVTSADALFSAVGAWAITMAVLGSAERRTSTQRVAGSLAAGALFALGLHLSYGLAPLALVPAAVILVRRRWSMVPWVAAGALLVTGAFVAGGFWWFDGLAATHERYLAGVAERRPDRYFALLGNPAAVGLALGPVVAVAVVRVRGWRAWLLPGAALAAMVAADLSGLSKAEVERIWLPFQPWILLLAGGLGLGAAALGRSVSAVRPPADPDHDPASLGVEAPSVDRSPTPPWWRPTTVTALLVLQVAVTIAIERNVRTPW